MSEDSSDAKISHLDNVLFRDEYILALDVSVQDFTIMHVFQAQADLSEPVQNLVFWEVTTSLLLNQLLQISTVCEIHDYAEVTLLCFVDFAESYYVWVIEHLQNLCFLDSFLALTITHRLDVDLLDDTEFLGRFSLHQECFAKGSLAE